MGYLILSILELALMVLIFARDAEVISDIRYIHVDKVEAYPLFYIVFFLRNGLRFDLIMAHRR
jgi:hypothetical protein